MDDKSVDMDKKCAKKDMDMFVWLRGWMFVDGYLWTVCIDIDDKSVGAKDVNMDGKCYLLIHRLYFCHYIWIA